MPDCALLPDHAHVTSGDDYQNLKPAIGIHLLDFNLFTEPREQPQSVWCFELRDRTLPETRLGDELELNIIELPKADRLGVGFGGAALSAWVTFLEHWQEEATMAQIDYPPVQQALDEIRTLSSDEEARHRAFARERALMDERSELRWARDEGRQEGLELGMQQGMREGIATGKRDGTAKMLERLLMRRFGPIDEDARTRIASASAEQLDDWTLRVLDAATLEDVLRDD